MRQFCLSPDFDTTFDQVVTPWLSAHGCPLAAGLPPAVVLAPSRSMLQLIRGRMARRNLAAAGVFFWTPNDLRRHLVRASGAGPVVEREGYHLILSTAAENLASKFPDRATPLAIARDPSGLARSLDSLSDAGWGGDALGGDLLPEIAADVKRTLDILGLGTVQERDREIRERSPSRLFSAVLVVGTHGAFWSLRPLLEAALNSAEHFTLVAKVPRLESDSAGLDESWVATWELSLGAPLHLVPSRIAQDRPGYPYADILLGSNSTQVPDADFATLSVGRSIADQADLAVQQTLRWLQSDGIGKDIRVGLVVPGPGALAQSTFRALSAANVPFLSDIPTPTPGFCESAEWRAYLQFLVEPSAANLLALLSSGVLPPELKSTSMRGAARLIQTARVHAFADDLSFVLPVIASDRSDLAKALAVFLASSFTRESNGLFSTFLSSFQTDLARWGWECHSSIWNVSGPLLDLPVSREGFLRWVDERGQTLAPAKNKVGADPYSNVVLTTYASADGQSFSHLACLGLNEGVFPAPTPPSSFLGEATIKDLNLKVRRLNATVRQDSPHGEAGPVAPNHGLLLGPSEERSTTLRSLAALIEGADKAAWFASAFDETNPGEILRPSDYLVRLAPPTLGRVPSPEDLLMFATGLSVKSPGGQHFSSVQQAYVSRRDPSKPFDQYSFGFGEGENAALLRLSPAAWESSIDYPAQAWTRAALRIELSRDEADLPWALAGGVWAHLWIAAAAKGVSGACVTNRSANHFTEAVLEASVLWRVAAEERYASRKMTPPESWLATFHAAKQVALSLATSLDQISVTEWPSFAVEYTIPKGTVARPAGLAIETEGRLDLVFFSVTAETVSEALAAKANTWVIDIKTGSNLPLTPKRLAKGEGLQIGLYANAMSSLGASEVLLTILKPGSPATPQVNLHDVLAQANLWDWVKHVSVNGCLGQLEEVRGDYKIGASLPLATLPIPASVLKAKWKRSHSVLIGE